MELCVVSGKGGTGKTTVAVGLAVALAEQRPGKVQLVDCDVEAPNAHLYLHPEEIASTPADVYVPQWNEETCIACGECARACAFGALGLFGTHLEIFAEHCHSCAACEFVCPSGAITAGVRSIGQVYRSSTTALDLSWGSLDVGEPRAVPIIEALREAVPRDEVCVVDGPPGTACSLVAAARGADGALIVTEPTPFGLHDLKLAAEVLAVLGVPAAVAINKAGDGRDRSIRDHCAARGLPILLEIPLDAAIASTGAAGIPLPVSHPEYSARFRKLWSVCEERWRRERVA